LNCRERVLEFEVRMRNAASLDFRPKRMTIYTQLPMVSQLLTPSNLLTHPLRLRVRNCKPLRKRLASWYDDLHVSALLAGIASETSKENPISRG